MKRWNRAILAACLTAGLAMPNAALAQQQAQQEGDKERRKRDKQLQRELASPYKKWLEEEVSYIISDEERSAFLRLGTNEEREQFIEQFWLRRDPTPDTIENEEKEEHYRRIAYANERFASGIPGWRTDRGRIYIMWGEPAEIESYPAGGSYTRPWEEGGGTTSVHPFEKWRYRYLEGIGNDIILEFVDPTGSGEYRLTMDPSEKDALLMVPGAGLSDLEAMGMASKTERFQRTDGTRLPTTMTGQPYRMSQFERLDLYAKIQRPPPVKFRDLEELVTARIVRNQLDFDYRFDFLRVTGDSVLVPISVQIANRQMSFQGRDGVHSATINIFARITTLTSRIVHTFEDVVQRDVPESLLAQSLDSFSIYQKAVPLRPGLYRLDLVLKDVNSGNVGAVNTALRVPRYADEQLAASTLILADRIERVSARDIGLGSFVLGAAKVRPRLGHAFTTEDQLGIYLQVYNLRPDEATRRTSATVEYLILKDKDEVARITETNSDLQQTGEQLTIEKLMPLASLEPGKYKLEIRITDQVSQQSIAPSAEFTVRKAPQRTAAR